MDPNLLPMQERFIAALAIFLLACLACAVWGWWTDRVLERRRGDMPKPQDRAVVGQTHKPWM